MCVCVCVCVCAGCCVLLLPTQRCVSTGCWWTTSRSWRSRTTSWGWSWKTDKLTETNSGYSLPPHHSCLVMTPDGWIIVSGLTTALFLISSPRLGFCPCCVLISDGRLLVLHLCLSAKESDLFENWWCWARCAVLCKKDLPQMGPSSTVTSMSLMPLVLLWCSWLHRSQMLAVLMKPVLSTFRVRAFVF